jgi:hypothetical protein
MFASVVMREHSKEMPSEPGSGSSLDTKSASAFDLGHPSFQTVRNTDSTQTVGF